VLCLWTDVRGLNSVFDPQESFRRCVLSDRLIGRREQRNRENSRGVFKFGCRIAEFCPKSANFIGGVNSDQKAALEYRLRYLVFALSVDEKQKLRKVANLVMNVDTPEGQRAPIAEPKSMRLGQIKFEITESRLTNGHPPMTVDWVKFAGVVNRRANSTSQENSRSPMSNVPPLRTR
jgi:hypothetical protein